MTTPDEAQAILPCPFCGGEAKFAHSYHEDDDRYPRDFWHVRIECTDCGATPHEWSSYGNQEQRVFNVHVRQKAEASAAEAWNTRISQSLPGDVGTVEGIKAHVERYAVRDEARRIYSTAQLETAIRLALAAPSSCPVSGENCLRCDDSGYQEFSSGGLMGGPVKVTRKFCDCACGQDARDQAAGVGMHAALTPSALSGDAGEGRLARASREAIELIDELNERATSRKFWGISQTMHNKLCTIRVTLARALPSHQGAGDADV